MTKARAWPKETYSIYALCEPDTGEARYIGLTVSPKDRYYQHMGKCPTKGSTACNQWIRGLVAQGKKPRMLILQEVTDYAEAKRLEYAWVRRYRTMGERVLNFWPPHGFCSLVYRAPIGAESRSA